MHAKFDLKCINFRCILQSVKTVGPQVWAQKLGICMPRILIRFATNKYNVQNSPHQNIAPFDHDFMAGHTYQTANRPKPGGSTYGGSARRGSTYRSSARRSARRSARHSTLKTLRTEALHMEALRTEALHDALH